MIPLFLALFLTAAEDPIRLDITRDTWLSGVGTEADGSNGGAPRLKLKSHQEFTLVDIDVTDPKLRNRIIQSATLHVKSAGEPRLKRVTVGGLASPFEDGTATGYEAQKGSSTFKNRTHPGVPWAGGGDVCNVLFGSRGNLWKTADATPPDKDGWQTIPVDPRVIAARIAGLSGGFVLFDDTGTEWTRDGEKFSRTLFPNRFIYSRDQNNASAPYFTVVLGDKDQASPDAPTDLRIEPETKDLPEGESLVSWIVPNDRGNAQGTVGTLGFRATFDGARLPLSVIPLADKPGQRVKMHLDRGPGTLSLQAVDAVGNVSQAANLVITPSIRPLAPLAFRVARPSRPAADVQPLNLGEATVSVVDELDKVDPVRGIVRADSSDYLLSNHVFEAAKKRVRLQTAKGEAVACQVVVTGKLDGLTASLEFAEASPAEVQVSRYVNVMSKIGPMPDPIVPLPGPIDIPEDGVKITSLHIELQVAKTAKTGLHKGKLILKSKTDRLELAFELVVSGFVLPDTLSFLPEMNCYGLPENERDFYRLAHRHRTVLNRVPYSHNGSVHEGFAPTWDGKALGWDAWDKRFGPLFDGSAFADLPRKNVPIELFYLPLFENWPTKVEGNYNGSYWADGAFSETYRKAFVEASKQIAAHVRSKPWNDTFFECFFNGKNDFKENGWSRATSPWLLDEPANFQDYWALRYFGGLFHEGINAASPGKAKLVFRADISRPQWQRDVLDDVLDMNIVGSAFRDYRNMVMERKGRLGQVVIEYGSSNAIEASNISPNMWCIDAWTLGLDGVLPWQTVGTADSWKTADELSLFYPGKDGGPPIPSIRLKAYRRGQQDVEYLTLLTKVSKEPRWSIARRVRSTLKSVGVRQGTGVSGAEDAGRIDYGKLSSFDMAAFRDAVRNQLDTFKATGEPKLIDLRTPKREPKPMSTWIVP